MDNFSRQFFHQIAENGPKCDDSTVKKVFCPHKPKNERIFRENVQNNSKCGNFAFKECYWACKNLTLTNFCEIQAKKALQYTALFKL